MPKAQFVAIATIVRCVSLLGLFRGRFKVLYLNFAFLSTMHLNAYGEFLQEVEM